MNTSTTITTQPEQVYGYKCQIELGTRRTIWKRWKVKHLSMARIRAAQVGGAMRTLQCLPLTKEQWEAENSK
ncbi:hypothetical protein [Prosthecobacter sp.]|uniref:hypothetical protein n=1 Tax=Prosthecobacter sp. TaxID=1965333 RepID=UPI0037831F3F